MKFIFIIFILSGMAFGSTMMKFSDTVRSIKKTQNDFLITFHEHAAIYHLKSEQKNFKEVESKLKKSLEAQKRIELEVNPESLEILR